MVAFAVWEGLGTVVWVVARALRRHETQSGLGWKNQNELVLLGWWWGFLCLTAVHGRTLLETLLGPVFEGVSGVVGLGLAVALWGMLVALLEGAGAAEPKALPRLLLALPSLGILVATDIQGGARALFDLLLELAVTWWCVDLGWTISVLCLVLFGAALLVLLATDLAWRTRYFNHRAYVWLERLSQTGWCWYFEARHRWRMRTRLVHFRPIMRWFWQSLGESLHLLLGVSLARSDRHGPGRMERYLNRLHSAAERRTSEAHLKYLCAGLVGPARAERFELERCLAREAEMLVLVGDSLRCPIEPCVQQRSVDRRCVDEFSCDSATSLLCRVVPLFSRWRDLSVAEVRPASSNGFEVADSDAVNLPALCPAIVELQRRAKDYLSLASLGESSDALGLRISWCLVDPGAPEAPLASALEWLESVGRGGEPPAARELLIDQLTAFHRRAADIESCLDLQEGLEAMQLMTGAALCNLGLAYHRYARDIDSALASPLAEWALNEACSLLWRGHRQELLVALEIAASSADAPPKETEWHAA